ncbi:ABC transporter ATP-binding protein [Streptomyces endophyticus]|uniref:ABC transporter ATP-binding protein n=1 Tax=Streptomyces endophyticus TaxID=714166 RepID=UPI00389A14AD
MVRRIAHRVAVMHQGRIVESGRAADVFDRPRDAYTRTLLGAIPRINPEWDRRRRAAPRNFQGVESA